jgi:PAS domain S-box-containing protein
MADMRESAAIDDAAAGPVRILVVDDRPENLLALGTILEAPDRALVLARSGREALRELLRQVFALILIDVNMPDMDGFETAELIRRRPASAHTPIIFMTADHDERLAIRSYAMGAVDYISTPVDPEVLRAKAAVFVELFRKTDENRRQAEQLRRAEERLRHLAEERLRQADERLRLTVESVTDYAIFSLGPGGRIASWNAGAARLFGYDEREAIGADSNMLYPPEDPGEPHWRRALADGRSEVEGWFECKGGSRFFGRGVVSVMRGPHGEIEGFSKVVQDVTLRKQAEEALARQAQQLQEANRLKDEFLAVLSHELRTPLNAIIGWTHMLRRERLEPVVARQALDAIARNGEAQLGLVNDILDVSRFMAGKLRLDLSLVDLRDAVKAAADTGAVAAAAKGIDLRVEVCDEALPVNGDAERLRQVVWNLVSNAVKFTPSGGHVSVAVERRGDTACVSVSDDGIGIAASFLPHAFERFRQADSSSVRAHSGLGLGLAIVRHLVELHGGVARVESAGEGCGARFEILLPALAAEASVAPGRRKFPPAVRALLPAAADAPAPNVPGLRCLVVDDDRDAREMLKATLEKCGMIVSLADSAGEAIEQVTSAQLLVADIGMPGEDGYSLIRRVRALPSDQGGRVPAVALTAYASDRDRQLALDAGFDRHLAKPVQHEELIETIAELLKEVATPPAGRPGREAPG